MENRHGAALFRLEPIRYVNAGTIHYPPGGTFGPRIQQDLQLVLLHTGHMEVDIDGTTHSVKPGNVVLLQPGRRETFTFSREQTTWHRWIAVHYEMLTANERAALDALPFSQPIPEPLNRLTDALLQAQSMYGKEHDAIKSLGLAALQFYAAGHNESLQANSAAHPSVAAAKSWLQEHFAEDISLIGLAKEAGVSPEHLVRLFRAGEGTTPIQYVWQFRVLKAIELLVQTGLPVNEIAARCGFKTSYHFARIVKKQTGRTPTDIRRASWNNRI